VVLLGFGAKGPLLSSSPRTRRRGLQLPRPSELAGGRPRAAAGCSCQRSWAPEALAVSSPAWSWRQRRHGQPRGRVGDHSPPQSTANNGRSAEGRFSAWWTSNQAQQQHLGNPRRSSRGPAQLRQPNSGITQAPQSRPARAVPPRVASKMGLLVRTVGHSEPLDTVGPTPTLAELVERAGFRVQWLRSWGSVPRWATVGRRPP